MVHEGAVVGRFWTPVLNPGKWFKLSFIYNKVRLRKKTPGRDDRGEGVGGLAWEEVGPRWKQEVE